VVLTAQRASPVAIRSSRSFKDTDVSRPIYYSIGCMQCRIKLLGCPVPNADGAPVLSHSLVCRTHSRPFKVGFGTYRHNDEKCSATVHSYWLYNTIIPICHKPTITVSLLWCAVQYDGTRLGGAGAPLRRGALCHPIQSNEV